MTLTLSDFEANRFVEKEIVLFGRAIPGMTRLGLNRTRLRLILRGEVLLGDDDDDNDVDFVDGDIDDAFALVFRMPLGILSGRS